VWERLDVVSALVVRLENVIRAVAADEGGNGARLQALRAEPRYELPWTEPRPLITVTVATIGRPELVEVALPSILGQSHAEIEVIVAADGAPEGTDAAVGELGDDRVRYLDLGPRVSWTDDPLKQWLVGATRARNAAMRVAAGSWVVCFDDDDAMRPHCLESLLELAREERAEAPYGQVVSHRDGEAAEICAHPPRENNFTWAGGMYHAGLRFFERQLLAAELGIPGDWWLAERMLRAGVRFAMTEEVVCDVYPSDRRPPD
jgi:glycosyltransferase involved in cell wall biosynthesis